MTGRNAIPAAGAAQPLEAQALERLWNRCHETGEHAEAIEALGRAIEADSGVARYHYMLGLSLIHISEPTRPY